MDLFILDDNTANLALAAGLAREIEGPNSIGVSRAARRALCDDNGREVPKAKASPDLPD